MFKICFDIDGVIAAGTEETVYSDEAGWAYEKCTPIRSTIETIRILRGEGHQIILMTARYESDLEVTKEWLSTHGVPYDRLIMGKPNADLYIDDKNYPRPYNPNDLCHYSRILEEATRHAGRRRD